MSCRHTYPNIDMERTGIRLKHMLSSEGYTPHMLKDYLHLSCVQPIYRWYKGKILPSVNHLLMLSELLNVHMEDLLVKKTSVSLLFDRQACKIKYLYKRLEVYDSKIKQLVA